MNISHQERKSREKAIRSSLASVRLESLEPSPETIKDMQAWRDGEISFDEVMSRVLERVRARPGAE